MPSAVSQRAVGEKPIKVAFRLSSLTEQLGQKELLTLLSLTRVRSTFVCRSFMPLEHSGKAPVFPAFHLNSTFLPRRCGEKLPIYSISQARPTEGTSLAKVFYGGPSRPQGMKGFRSSRMNTTYTQELVQIVAPVMQTATAKARATVLLAEDDRSLRRYLEVMLQRAGYNVIVAADGLEALKAALSSEVDAVVTDAVMPHLSGYELCRFLRRHPKLGRLPLVLLSGNDGQGEPDSNADAYLSKPVRAEELTGCVARLLSLAA